MLKIYLLIHRN